MKSDGPFLYLRTQVDVGSKKSEEDEEIRTQEDGHPALVASG
jgi:hypothetical protein